LQKKLLPVNPEIKQDLPALNVCTINRRANLNISPGRMKMKEKQLQRGLRKNSSFPMQFLSWMGHFYLLGLHQAVMMLPTTMGGNMHTLWQ
jgi:hypothetical protein